MENCNFTWKPVGTGISPTLGHRGCWPGEEREERRDKRARSGKERSRGNKRGRVTVLWMRATPGVEGNAGKMERGDGRHRCIVRMQGRGGQGAGIGRIGGGTFVSSMAVRAQCAERHTSPLFCVRHLYGSSDRTLRPDAIRESPI